MAEQARVGVVAVIHKWDAVMAAGEGRERERAEKERRP